MRSSRYRLLPLLLLASASVQAQTGPVLGSTVRISSRELRSGHGSGVLQRVTADSLVVSGKAVSRSSIGRIDVSSGRKANLLKGMGFGFVSGVAVGGLVSSGIGPHSAPSPSRPSVGAKGDLGLSLGFRF